MHTSKKIFKAFTATAIGQILNLLRHVILVPLFLVVWGTELYGEWVSIISLPSMIVMLGSMGFNSAGSNEIVMSIANSNIEHAKRVYQNVFTLIFFFGVTLILIAYLLVTLFPVSDFLNINLLSSLDVTLIVLVFVLRLVINEQATLYFGIFGALDKYSLGIFYSNIFIFAEIIAVSIGLFLHVEPFLLSLIYLFPILIKTIFGYIFVRKNAIWARIERFNLSLTQMKSLLPSSLSFLAITVNQAVINQGIVIIIANRLGSNSVTVFTTIRILTYSVRQLLSIFNRAAWNEFSIQYGKKNIAKLAKMFYALTQLTTIITIVSVVFLLIFGKWIYVNWTGKQIVFNDWLYNIMLLYVMINSMWQVGKLVQISTNNHQRLAFFETIMSIIVLILTYLTIDKLGIVAPAIFLLLFEFTLYIFSQNSALKILNSNWSNFVYNIFAYSTMALFYERFKNILRSSKLF
jgi:O-antigen/teichoic acid export membrane protein